ncbi:hypothetical protein CU044_0599 [Streptomyces sp. L-9-10]|nr:hypothetical protein CU044_0599 [Streptomyces sp. L-9-10]
MSERSERIMESRAPAERRTDTPRTPRAGALPEGRARREGRA